MTAVPNPMRLLEDDSWASFDVMLERAAEIMGIPKAREGHKATIWARLMKLEQTKQVSCRWVDGVPEWRGAPRVDAETLTRRAVAHSKRMKGLGLTNKGNLRS